MGRLECTDSTIVSPGTFLCPLFHYLPKVTFHQLPDVTNHKSKLPCQTSISATNQIVKSNQLLSMQGYDYLATY